MAELLKQGKQKTGSQVKEEFRKGRGSKLLDSILDVLLGDKFDSDIADWCLWLISGGQGPEDFLNDLKSHNTSPVCGLVWNAHFVAYRCRDCAISPCMSLCADCFVNGNHEGHDFNMFRSQAGGACDCGDENVMRKQGFCTNHQSSKTPRQDTLPYELSSVAQSVISRLLLKIYEEFQSKKNESISNKVPPTVEGLLALLQKLSEADELRSCIAKSILMTVPHRSKTKHRRTSSISSGASRLRPTNSTESGHTLVHSIPGSPRSPDFMSEHESFDLLEHNVLNPAQEMDFEGASFSYLEYMMHIMVKYEFPNVLATFMLLLLPEQTYKESFTRYFCRNYLSIGKKLSQSSSPELLSNHLVHVSVQLFSSEVLATDMVREENLLNTLIAVLLDMVGSCLQSYEYVTEGKTSSVLVANCDHRILVNHCYWPVASDLLNVMSHKDIVKTFLENDQLMHQWMYLVTLITGMNVNTRRISSHIQFEPRTYITSFSVEFESVAAVMWELLRGCNKLKEENNRYILKLIKTTEAALNEWYNFVPVRPCKSTATFHLSLHRYYALFMSQAIVSFGLDESEVLPRAEFLAQAAECPLRALVTLSEIKAGYWVYSGFQMRGQALSYVQCHFCNSMVDLDLLFVQIAASQLDPEFFLTLLIDRFSLKSWFQFGLPLATDPPRQDTEKETSMVESFLSFILIILSQRVFIGLSEHEQCKKDLAALLCVSNKTHSQLSDMIPTKPGENQETSKKFEISLAEMADFKAPSLDSDVMQQGTYSPKDIVWDNYFDYTHILLRFFMASEYQKANKRYSENMKDRNATIHTSCWPPFKSLEEIHPSFRGILRLLQSRMLQKIIFFILYKAVYHESSVSELMLINTIHLIYHAMHAPAFQKEGVTIVKDDVDNKRILVAEKCVDFLEKFASDKVGLYGQGAREFHELNATLCNGLFEDIHFRIDDDTLHAENMSSRIEDVTTVLQHVLFSKKNFSMFEPMLAYMDDVVDERPISESLLSRHLHHLRYLLSILSEARYLFLKKLSLHWRRCAARDKVEIEMYHFCKYRQDRPGFSMLLTYLTVHCDWLFRVHKVGPNEPVTVFDIDYSKGTITDNASVPIVINTRVSNDEQRDSLEEKEDTTKEKHSLISFLIALMEKLKQTSKCISPEKMSEASRQDESTRAGDGAFQIQQLLQKLHGSAKQNQMVIDELAPKVGGSGTARKKQSGLIDDSMKEKFERRKRAMARQKKILQEFMTKQELFKEQHLSTDASMEVDQVQDIAVTSERQYDCVICGQTSSSTADRPFGEAVLLQATTVLASRRKQRDYKELPEHREEKSFDCGKAVHQRKEAIIANFDKVPAGRALEVGLDCGIHVQTCGHYMHIDCHQSYFNSLQEEHLRVFVYEQPQFDITKGFFNCPLCRQPCTGVLPILPDSMRKRSKKRNTKNNSETLKEITNLLRKYAEGGSLSALTAKALEFTVLTASTATFMALLSNTLKCETHFATMSYSDNTIKEKFLILASTIRTCLELDYIQINSGIKTQDDRASCLGNLIEILQFHAQCLDGPMMSMWRELVNDQTNTDSGSNYNSDRSRVPLLLNDVACLLIQFVLTWPNWIAPHHFRYLVKVLFNLHVVQAFVNISLKLENEEFKSWQRMGQSQQSCSGHAAYALLGVVSAALAKLKEGFLEEQVAMMTGISQSLLSPHAIELQAQEFCLPFLRIAASISRVLFGTPLIRHQDHDEFVDLVITFELVEEDVLKQSRDILPTQCLNWPYAEPHSIVQSWCQHLVEVLRLNCSRDLKILPISHGWAFPRLLPLPKSYDRLFQFYRKSICNTCRKVPDDPAICLICGTFTCFRSSCCSNGNGIYECVKHSVECGCGTGVFLIISTSAVLIIRSERGCIWGSVYLDSFGEEDKDLKRGKPLFLSDERYARLQQQWLTHSFDRTCKRWGLHNGKL